MMQPSWRSGTLEETTGLIVAGSWLSVNTAVPPRFGVCAGAAPQASDARHRSARALRLGMRHPPRGVVGPDLLDRVGMVVLGGGHARPLVRREPEPQQVAALGLLRVILEMGAAVQHGAVVDELHVAGLEQHAD